MIELVITVCLLSSPGDCKQEKMPFEGPLMACAMQGQLVAVDWINNHPKWHIRRWRCGPSENNA